MPDCTRIAAAVRGTGPQTPEQAPERPPLFARQRCSQGDGKVEAEVGQKGATGSTRVKLRVVANLRLLAVSLKLARLLATG